MSFFLAIDAGGTKTDYLLADDSRELARTRTGTIKRMRTDATTAATNLEPALASLTARTGIPTSSIDCTCIGTAGETVPLVIDWLREALGARVAGRLILLGDVEIALDAAFLGAPGVLVLAGTGSNVAGRDHAGEVTTAGGWGPALADQGSGHRIGQQSLRALFLARDEGRSSLLLPALLDLLQLDSMYQIIEYANRIPAPDFSRLPQVILGCAEQGDEVAQSVLRQEGEDLAYLVRLVIRWIRSSSPDEAWVPPIAFAGSIVEKIAPLRRALIDAVRVEFPGVQAKDGVVDPILGVLWRARKGA
jgi:glucosamine kinase